MNKKQALFVLCSVIACMVVLILWRPAADGGREKGADEDAGHGRTRA